MDLIAPYAQAVFDKWYKEYLSFYEKRLERFKLNENKLLSRIKELEEKIKDL